MISSLLAEEAETKPALQTALYVAVGAVALAAVGYLAYRTIFKVNESTQ